MGKSKVGKEVMYLTKKYTTHLTDKQIKQMKVDYAELGSIRAVARKNKVSYPTARRVLQSQDDMDQIISQKKEQNTKDFLQFMQDRNDEIQSLLVELLKGMRIKAKELDDTDIKGLSTAFGIVMDKQLKMVELSRGNANNEQITKVRELLDKLEDEANK